MGSEFNPPGVDSADGGGLCPPGTTRVEGLDPDSAQVMTMDGR